MEDANKTHEPSACLPVSGGADFAAFSALAHKSLADWLAAQVFVSSRHMKLARTSMLSAEPWGYDSGP